MTPSWLANTDPAHAWAHLPWPSIPALGRRAGACAILPLFPLSQGDTSLAADHGECVGSEVLRLASLLLGTSHPHLVLPPLRFTPACSPEALFALDYATAHALALSLAAHVQASGFSKLVFFCPDPELRPFAATLAIDARAEFDLHGYVLALGNPALAHGAAKPEMLLAEAHSTAGLIDEISRHRNRHDTPALELQVLPAAALPLPHPAYRSRYLGALTPAALAAAGATAGAIAVVPTASIEQHGRHLPLGVDAILGQALLSSALSHVPADFPVWVAPAITYGKSNEHAGWPGTLSISAPQLHATASACVAQLAALGFRRILFYNTHGGNTAVLSSLLSAAPRSGPSLGFLRGTFKPTLSSAQETEWGMHADEWETSLMLACSPELVDLRKATCEYPALLTDPGVLRPEKAPATFAWLTRDVSRSGVMGDATAASLDKGALWLEQEGRSLAAALVH